MPFQRSELMYANRIPRYENYEANIANPTLSCDNNKRQNTYSGHLIRLKMAELTGKYNSRCRSNPLAHTCRLEFYG